MPSSQLASRFEVLVVDDEAGARELLMEYFRARGFAVTGAQDGRAAIVALQRPHARFGLVVTDLNLPGADGFAVLHAARQANESCYVVIVTGYASLDSAIRAVRVGAYDYLTKPFSLGQLDVILSRICDRAGLELENRQLLERQTPPASRPKPLVAPMPALVPPIVSVEDRLSDVEGSLRRIEGMLQSFPPVDAGPTTDVGRPTPRPPVSPAFSLPDPRPRGASRLLSPATNAFP